MKIAFANKFAVIAALILGGIGVIVGTISDTRAPCKQEIEDFITSSPQVESRVGKVASLTQRREVSVDASTNEAAYIISDYIVRGQSATALIEVRTDPTTCSCVIADIDPM